ncbi:FtsX-like permease family protein [Streptomyces sp. NPDC004667]|uniref:FtsX-like permease family protein n=1 Tax=Streptomyces sp. NPDC004667 TaxID=3154285 RepID=UPI0033ACC74D
MLGFVMRRLRGRWPLAAAVLLTVLITTTALTALLAFTRSVGDAGMRRALTGPERARTAVVLTGDHALPQRPADDAAVRDFTERVFASVPTGTESVARSRSYGLPGERAPGKDADLTVLAALARDRVRLLAGKWPEAVGPNPGRLPVALPTAALTRLGLAPERLPAEVRLEDRLGGAPLDVLVTGVYRAAEPDAPYWRLDPLGGREVRVGSFTTYGPLLVDDSAFTAGGLPQGSRATLLTPDFTGTPRSGVEAVRGRAAAAETTPPSGLTVSGGLASFIADVQSGQRVARSTLLVGALQLSVLASAALLLVAGLLRERQEPERVLLTARGASRGRLGLLSTAESLLLAAPAVVLAPLLAPLLLRFTGRYGPLAHVPFDTGGSWLLWPAAAVFALLCVLLTTLPAVLRGATATALRRGGRRRAVVSGFARSGADLALVALAVLAYRQLSRYSGGEGDAAPAGGDVLGVDPVLVAAPTLALCAGTLLVLRLLPFAARLGGRVAARGRGLGPALVGWQLARRPQRATGPVLLLVLAVSSGVLALGQHSAWSASQRDQADFATAGGLRVTGGDLAPMGRGGRYAALPGGDRIIPVIHTEVALPDRKPGRLLALDSRAAGRLPLRADLRDGRPMAELFAPLAVPPAATAAGRAPGGDGIDLPGTPRRIDLDVTVTAPTAPATSGRPSLALLLRDRFGLTYRTPVTALPENGDGTVSVRLDPLTGSPLGSAAGPLAIVGVAMSYGAEPAWFDSSTVADVAGDLAVRRVSLSGTPDGPGVPVAATAPDWNLRTPEVSEGVPAAALRPAGPDLLRLHYEGRPGVPVQISLSPGGPPAELRGVATRGFLAAMGASVGDNVSVRLGVTTVQVRVTAAVGSLPVAGDTALAVDLNAAARRLAAADAQDLPIADEWWLPAASPGDPEPARAAAALRAGAGSQKVVLREEVAGALLRDPLSAGPQAALAALAVACAVLAAIGFAASAAASGRERAREHAILSALGASRPRLTGTAAAEACLLVGLGTAVGVGLGAAIVHLVVPLTVLTPAARRPVPGVVVDLPTTQTLLLALAVAAVPLLSAVLGGRGGRTNRGAAARLRYVEEM